MDAHTLDLLEFPKIRALVAARAGTSLGKERVLALAPATDLAPAREALDLVTEMVDALAARLDPPLGGLKDVRLWIKRAALGVMLELDQLADVRAVLGFAERVRDYARGLGNDYPLLSRRLQSVGDFRAQLRVIDEAIDERGRVRDSATEELARIRAAIARLDERIQGELRRLIRAPEVKKALRYAQSTLAGEHHVLPVAVNYRHLVPGVIHRTSSSGETIYVEPAKVAEIAADLAVLRHAELREIRRVLRRLSAALGAVASPALATIDALAELDFIRAKAEFSRAYAMAPPAITTDGPLRLDEVRHPLLLELRRAAAADGSTASEVVPISITLGGEYDLLVITGPNTGGKTVALKTVGLACVMALSGLHIPARAGSRVPLLADILADIGDEQSLAQSLSTFSGHISRIASILGRAGPRTLVLLDELGAGTDPTEGAALGRAILDELVQLQCRGMVTTHLGDLKTVALAAKRVENAAVEFDPVSLRPTYRLLVGQFGQSCALKIARRLDLPRSLVDRARKYLRRRRGKRAPELVRLQAMREQAELARREAQRAQAEAELAQTEFQRKTDLLEQESAISRELERFRTALAPGDLVRVPRLGKEGTIRRVDGKKRSVAVTIGAVEWQLGMDEILPIPKTATAGQRTGGERPNQTTH